MTPGWWLAAAAAAALVAPYAAGVARRPATLPPWSPWRTTAWVTGALLVAASVSPPLADLAVTDHRAHMVQHLLLGMYAPLGLVLGAPARLLLGSVRPRRGRRLSHLLRSAPVHVLSHPVTAGLLDVGALYVLYLTPLEAAVRGDPALRWLVLGHFLAAGCLFTWSIAGTDPGPRRPSVRARAVVLVAAAGAHAALAKLLHARAVRGGHGPSDHTGTHDPAHAAEAAVWMYYGGDGAEVLLAVALLATWYRRRRHEHRAVAGDATHALTSSLLAPRRLPGAKIAATCKHPRVTRSFGVEEELLLVGPDGGPIARAQAVLEGAHPEHGPLEPEFMEEQIETATEPMTSLDDLTQAILDGRAGAEAAAQQHDAHIAAVGTSPVPIDGTTMSKVRYLRARTEFGLTAREQLTNGCHVHVSVADDTEGVAVIDRIGPWLAPLLALSANSPFWQGDDSGFASFRSQVWARWPTAGPSRHFGTPEAYHAAVEALVATGTVLDHAMVYFDARLSAKYPTVEIRVADVCLDPRTAALLAALSRALVETAAREAADGRPAPDAPTELLRTAHWRAGRSGITGDLLHPRTFRPAPAHDVVGVLVEHVRDALVDAGDLDTVTDTLGALWSRGNGAARQRAWYAESQGDLHRVALAAAEATLAGAARTG